MGAEIPWETRERAEELYIYDGLTYEQTAAETGVSQTQLQRWGAAGNWPERKREHRRALTAIRRDQVRARQKLISGALASLDPQQVYAFAALEKLALARTDPGAERRPAGTGEPVRIDSPADAVEALQEVVEKKLGRMLDGSDPVTLQKIKDMKAALELVEKMKAKYSPDVEQEHKGLSDAAVDDIKRQILGIDS